MPNRILQFPVPAGCDTAALVDQAAALKDTITDLTEQLRRVNLTLAERADYKPGSKTGHLAGRRYVAKVQRKDYVKWDQDLLHDAREVMGDVEFFRVFKWTFEPKSAKTLAGAMEFGAHAELIQSARTVTEGSPYVTFERLEDC